MPEQSSVYLAESALLSPRKSFQAHLPVSFENLGLAFGNRVVYKDFNFSLNGHGITAIMGPNGAGKSLLLRLMAGLIQPTVGRVAYSNSKHIPREQIGFVFQRPVLLRRSVSANLRHALSIAGMPRQELGPRVQALLQLGGMVHLAGSPARMLSGGEQQRLTLLRALAAQPGLLLLDEPSASLDPQATALIESIVRRASECGVKVVLVTHDAGQVARLADEVVFVHRGTVHAAQPTKEFLKEPASREASAYLAGELLID